MARFDGRGAATEWSRDGKEIFFLTLDGRLMATPVSLGQTVTAGAPQALFATTLRVNTAANQYAVAPDGQRFLMAVPIQDVDAEPFRVIVNWRARP